MCLWERLFIETHNVSKGEAVRGRSSLNYLFLHNFGNLSKVKDTFREIIASKTGFDLNVRAHQKQLKIERTPCQLTWTRALTKLDTENWTRARTQLDAESWAHA